jgi:hypothetical protein
MMIGSEDDFPAGVWLVPAAAPGAEIDAASDATEISAGLDPGAGDRGVDTIVASPSSCGSAATGGATTAARIAAMNSAADE